MDYFCMFCITIAVIVYNIADVQAQNRSEYLLVFPVHHNYSTEGLCELIITSQSRENATIFLNVPFFNIGEIILLSPYETLRKDFDCRLRLGSEGALVLENRTVYIESNQPLKVQVYNVRNGSGDDTVMGDSYSAVALKDNMTEYMILTKDEDHCTLITGPTAFYAVAASEDNTQVTVYNQYGSSYFFTLNAYQAVTNFSTESNQGFCGYRVVASKAITVYAGDACVLFYTGVCGVASYMMDAVPDYSIAGLTHVVPPIAGRPGIGHQVRVTALHNDTYVYYEDQQVGVTLDAGQYDQMLLPESEASPITCDKACLVVLYSPQAGCREEGPKNGVFQMFLTPTNWAQSEFMFATLLSSSYSALTTELSANKVNLAVDFTLYLSIVSNNKQIYLNTTALEDLDWVTNSWGYHHTAVPLTGGNTYYLVGQEGVDNIEFMVYLYGHYDNGAGYGTGLQFSSDFSYIETPPTTSTSIPPTTTVPISDNNPTYRIKLGGLHESENGQNLTQECLIQYSLVLDEVSSDMIDQVNSEIPTLCNNSIGYVITSVSSILVQKELEIRYQSSFSEAMSPSTVDECSQFVSLYLQNHSNWQDPVLPAPDLCPQLFFPEEKFSDEGMLWLCDEATDRNADNELEYKLNMYGIFHTDGQVDLPVECLLQHSSNMEQEAQVMLREVNERVGSELCLNQTETKLASVSLVFTSEGQQVLSYLKYFVDVFEDYVFSATYQCSDETLSFLMNHSNWIDPILPPVQGCPDLIYQGNDFQCTESQWNC